MKNLLKVTVFSIAFLTLGTYTCAEDYNTDYYDSYDSHSESIVNYYDGYTENWEVSSFHSDIIVNKDGQVAITENILADFTNETHHGVGRSIPYEYTGTGFFSYNAELDFVSATNENDQSWDNDVYRSDGYLNVDMYAPNNGDLTSQASFILKYTANNVIGFFDEKKAKQENTFPHDEFYWNVNGTDWAVLMKKVSATVHLPKSFSKDELSAACFTGTYGSEAQNCKITALDSQTLEFKTTQPLAAYENLTVVVGMPPGTIPPPSPFKKIWKAFVENWGIPFAVLILTIMYLLWYTHGRDDETVSNTVMPHYEPPKDILPTETGTIIDETLDPKDITATILDYAVKGFIKINELEEKGLLFKSTDYELELLKPYITTKEYENLILSAIFPTNQAGLKIKISTLTNKFYIHIPKIEKSVMNQLVKDDFFPHNPSSVRTTYGAVGGVILIGIIFFGEIVIEVTGMSIASLIGIGISGFIIILFGNKMPHKTKKGTETYYKLKGLYEYINTAEKDRMKFQEKNNIMFEKLLPYAMAFGLIDKWAKAFDGLIKNPPSWYHANRPWGTNGFTMVYFASRLSSIGDKMSQNISSRPGGKGGHGGWSGGSGFGGGFSGGGFGGGGGRGL